MQTEKTIKETQIADLQENIKSQQEATFKAKEELKGALTGMEQLKESFKTEPSNWETERVALLKRAENVEATIKPVEEELTGLKHQVNSMTAAVFGKYSIITCFSIFINSAGLTLNS